MSISRCRRRAPRDIAEPRLIQHETRVIRSGVSPTVQVRRRYPLDARFVVARVRLARLLHEGTLTPASEDAYRSGLAALSSALGTGPFVSALAGLRLLEPATGAGIVTLPLHWEATDPAGQLLTVLDADLMLTAVRARTMLRLVGSFRLPFVAAGPAAEGWMLPQLAATASADSLLTRVASALASPGAGP
jgi:hypothetical protein